MKRIMSILIVLAMICSLAACTQSNLEDNTTAAPESSATEAESTEVTEGTSANNITTDNATEGTTEAESEDESEDAPEIILEPALINGVSIAEYTIVYDAEGLDYNKRAAEYVQSEILARCGVKLQIVDDSTSPSSHEIIIGETSRELSLELDKECEGLEFSMLTKNGNVALEGDYFIIAAAAYYFIDTYKFLSGANITVDDGSLVSTPIVKEAKNYILLIGDGMGVNHTLLFDYLEDTSDYSDKEDLFYGYLLPYKGFSRTDSLSGTTDSAAGGTAIACGQKTYNAHIGIDKDQNDIQSLTELAISLGMAGAVMSTENKTGATPAAFSAHALDREDSQEISEDQTKFYLEKGAILDCGYDYYNYNNVNKIIEKHIKDTLSKASANENGFFLMYEEAYTDKHSHNNDIEKIFLAMLRFNQAIGRFMEFAFYNPDTFVLITADHETGGILIDEDGNITFTSDDHTSANVPIFAYGYGAELFNSQTIENIQIGQTIASFFGVYDFGDQSEFSYLK